jgi:hypothetical protein
VNTDTSVSYLLFIAVLFLSAVIFSVLRLLSAKVNFAGTLSVVGNVILLLPIATMIYLLMLCAAALLLGILALVLHTSGDLAELEAQPWAGTAARIWLLVGPFLLYGGLLLREWGNAKQHDTSHGP